MAAQEEEFSFPTITTNTPPRFIESPPLWPTTSTSSFDYETLRTINKYNQRRSFSCIEGGVKRESEEEEEEEREGKMDMLWEDFMNEEQSKGRGMVAHSPEKMVELGCVGALKLSKTGGKRPNMVVLVKVLKKLFLLHNSNRARTKPMW